MSHIPDSPPNQETVSPSSAGKKASPLYRLLAPPIAIITLVSGGISLATGEFQDAISTLFIISQLILIYISLASNKPSLTLLAWQTLILGTQLFITHGTYKQFLRLDRISRNIELAYEELTSTPSREELEKFLQDSNETISLVLEGTLPQKNSRVEALFQGRNRALELYLSKEIEDRLLPDKQAIFLAPLPEKTLIYTEKIRATIFGSLILMCVGAYLFTLRTHYRTTYGVIEVGFSAIVASTALTQLLDTDGVNGWIGIGASVYLVVRGLDNVGQGLANLRLEAKPTTLADNSPLSISPEATAPMATPTATPESPQSRT